MTINLMAKMSKRYWNSVGEHNLLKSLGVSSYLTLVHTSRKKARYYNSDLDEESSDDDEDYSVKHNIELGVSLLLVVGTLVQHAEVHRSFEDLTIEFGKMLVLDNFNDSQCMVNFRFKQVHLKKVYTFYGQGWNCTQMVNTTELNVSMDTQSTMRLPCYSCYTGFLAQ